MTSKQLQEKLRITGKCYYDYSAVFKTIGITLDKRSIRAIEFLSAKLAVPLALHSDPRGNPAISINVEQNQIYREYTTNEPFDDYIKFVERLGRFGNKVLWPYV